MIKEIYFLQDLLLQENKKYSSLVMIFNLNDFKVSYLRNLDLEGIKKLYEEKCDNPEICFLNFSLQKVRTKNYLKTALDYKYKSDQSATALQLNDFSIYSLLFDMLNNSCLLYKDGKVFDLVLELDSNYEDILLKYEDRFTKKCSYSNIKKPISGTEYSFSFITDMKNKFVFDKYGLDCETVKVYNKDVLLYHVNPSNKLLWIISNSNIDESYCMFIYTLNLYKNSYKKILKVNNDDSILGKKLNHFDIVDEGGESFANKFIKEIKKEIDSLDNRNVLDIIKKESLYAVMLKNYYKLNLILHALNYSITFDSHGVFRESIYDVFIGIMKYKEE